MVRSCAEAPAGGPSRRRSSVLAARHVMLGGVMAADASRPRWLHVCVFVSCVSRHSLVSYRSHVTMVLPGTCACFLFWGASVGVPNVALGLCPVLSGMPWSGRPSCAR